MKNIRLQSNHHRTTITVIVILSLFIGSGMTLIHPFRDLNELRNDSRQFPDKIHEPIVSAPTDFISTWNTSALSIGSSRANQIKLPLEEGGDYDFTVDWGDLSGTDVIVEWDHADVTHTYASDASEGIYTIIISGTIIGWKFGNGYDKLKLLEISQWGDLNFGNNGSYFSGCNYLNLTATDAPDLTGTSSLYRAFSTCYNLGSNGNMISWDVSSVTNMYNMFSNAITFNQYIGSWDVSSVTNMFEMFSSANNFNQYIGNWDVSSVTNMYRMFKHAKTFNQYIGNWDVSNVINMEEMFDSAFAFDRDIGNWDVSSVTNMEKMFAYAVTFNQSIGGWDVSSVISMKEMFLYAMAFDQNIGVWNVSSVISMEEMFLYAKLSPLNYNSLFLGWAQLHLQSDVLFHGGDSRWGSFALDARRTIYDNYHWQIMGGQQLYVYPPRNLRIFPGNEFIALEWSSPVGLTMDAIVTYNISRSDRIEGPFAFLVNVNTTSYTDASVVNNQTYYYRFETFTEYGKSTYSEILHTTPNFLTASFNVSATTVFTGEDVNFIATATGGDTRSEYIWNWNFGDGITISLQNPNHVYDSSGTFTVTLNVTDYSGDSVLSTIDIIVITDLYPAASFTVVNQSVLVDSTFVFTDTTTGGDTPLSYSWDFDDGDTSTEQNPTHSYNATGTYTVSLNVTDYNGDVSSYSLNITVLAPETDDTNDDDNPNDDTQNGGIPGYSIGIFVLSVAITLFLIQRRKISKL